MVDIYRDAKGRERKRERANLYRETFREQIGSLYKLHFHGFMSIYRASASVTLVLALDNTKQK